MSDLGWSRRRFVRQSVGFSAMAGVLRAVPGCARVIAPSADQTAHHVLALGDWGRDNSQVGQRAVAAAMQQYQAARNFRTETVLLLGDTWYGELAGGVNCPRWQWQFEDMYPRSAFDCPMYSIMGNHDYQKWPDSKVQAELDYAKRPGGRYTQPALWYTFQFPAAKPLVTVIALDSNMPHTTTGRDFTMTEQQRVDQLAWLETELQKPLTTPFLVVMGHHGIYSDGPHGDHAVLIRDWEPLLRKYKAHLYLAGHDHDLQHLEFVDHPTSFVGSGAGGADLYDLKVQPSVRGPYAEKVFGFTHLEITAPQIVVRHVNAEGQIVHAFAKTPDGTVALLA